MFHSLLCPISPVPTGWSTHTTLDTLLHRVSDTTSVLFGLLMNVTGPFSEKKPNWMEEEPGPPLREGNMDRRRIRKVSSQQAGGEKAYR